MLLESEREQVVRACQAMQREGLVVGTAGNVSVRVGDRVAISPSAVEEIPPSHYYSALFGGSVRVAPFALFGTDQLATNVADALHERTGALMANHGAITTGATLDKALSLLPYLEYICEIQLRAMASGHPVKLISPEEMAEAVSGMSTYGQQPRKEN